MSCLIARARLLIFAFFGFFMLNSSAAIQVDRIRLNLTDSSPYVTLKVKNTGKNPVNVEMDIKKWSQDKTGKDIYTNANGEILLSPPILRIPGDATKLLRVGVPAVPNDKELDYRLYITSSNAKIKSNNNSVGTFVKLKLRLGLPIYVYPKASESTDLKWKVQKLAGNNLGVTLTNDGNIHTRVTSLELINNATGKVVWKTGEVKDVLPGASHTFKSKVLSQISDKLKLTGSIMDPQSQNIRLNVVLD